MQTNESVNQSAKGLALLYFILLIIVVFPLMGVVYASIIRAIAVFLFTGAVVIIPWLAAFGGYCLGYIVHLFISKNTLIALSRYENLVITLALIIAYYVHWLLWVVYVINSYNSTNTLLIPIQSLSNLDQIFTLIKQPQLLLESIIDINSIGTWSIDDDEDLRLGPSKGIVLTVFWSLELLLILLYPYFVKDKQQW
jgi:hypothetical protein